MKIIAAFFSFLIVMPALASDSDSFSIFATVSEENSIFIESEGLEIELTHILDSRCPRDPMVRCVWEGNVLTDLALTWEDGRNLEISLELLASGSSDRVEFAPGQYISIQKALPYPVSFEPQDLELTVEIQFAEPASCQLTRRYCTMEFAPAVCAFDGREFHGANECLAIEDVRSYACENSLLFNESQVSCRSTLN